MRNILLMGYIIISVFLYTLNFELFQTGRDIDLGFGIFTTFPVIIVMAIGLIFCLFFFLIDKNKQMKNEALIDNLKNEITIHKKDLEIATLKMNSMVIESPIVVAQEIN
jgi:type III secretory pathway component EscV